MRKDAKGSFTKAPGSLVETKAENEGKGVIAGWATTAMPDVVNHIIAHGAFAESIKERGTSGPRAIKLLIDHESSKPAGRITKLEYRAKGLWIEAEVDLNISYAKDRYYAAKSQGGLSFSVGFRPSQEPGDIEWVETESSEYLIIHKGDLREVSVVVNPANTDAIMEFIKSEVDDPQEFLTNKAATPRWRVGAGRNLPVSADTRWDGAAAKSRIFASAGFDDDDADPVMARRAFLVYDAANPNLKGSYKLPFADIVDGRLRASPAGLRAAASRLPQTDIPDSVKARARDVIDSYMERFEKAAKELTLPQLQTMLVDEGWVKDDEAAEGLVEIIKANVHLFEGTAPTEAKSTSIEKAAQRLKTLRELLNNQKEA